MSEDKYAGRRERGIEQIVKAMHEQGLSTEADFHHVKTGLLPERSEDAFESDVYAITWPDVKPRL
jgi:hypothetical protein